MVRFAHIADCHLGGWKQEPLQKLNFQSFQKTIDICIEKKLDFVLIAGDLFDSAYPPIEILKETFAEFKKLKDAKIPCFLIAGSHDYSVSGKTFLDVLEKAGFCKNVENVEFDEENDKFILHPYIYKNVALYGYPGKKSGLEIQDLNKIKLNDAPGMFKIFMLHTTIDKVINETLPIDSVSIADLPSADYYALGHIHVIFQHENFVYPSPTFPNNFMELANLRHGRFVIVDTDSPNTLERIELKLKEVEKLELEVSDGFIATEEIISKLNRLEVKDKIILLKIKGELENGRVSDIKFQKIEEFIMERGAYFLLKNIHDLKIKRVDLEVEVDMEDSENIEEETIKSYKENNPADLNKLISPLLNALSLEKQEDEKNEVFQNRVLSEAQKILKF